MKKQIKGWKKVVQNRNETTWRHKKRKDVSVSILRDKEHPNYFHIFYLTAEPKKGVQEIEYSRRDATNLAKKLMKKNPNG